MIRRGRAKSAKKLDPNRTAYEKWMANEENKTAGVVTPHFEGPRSRPINPDASKVKALHADMGSTFVDSKEPVPKDLNRESQMGLDNVYGEDDKDNYYTQDYSGDDPNNADIDPYGYNDETDDKLQDTSGYDQGEYSEYGGEYDASAESTHNPVYDKCDGGEPDAASSFGTEKPLMPVAPVKSNPGAYGGETMNPMAKTSKFTTPTAPTQPVAPVSKIGGFNPLTKKKTAKFSL
jgi:hypothetical protein